MAGDHQRPKPCVLPLVTLQQFNRTKSVSEASRQELTAAVHRCEPMRLLTVDEALQGHGTDCMLDAELQHKVLRGAISRHVQHH